jgi:hypothetical protein
MSEKQAKLLKAVRQALLMIVDAIEEALEMERTSELRRKVKELSRLKTYPEGELSFPLTD